MKSIIPIILTTIFASVFSLNSFGQTCPEYSLSGPPGVVDSKNLAVFQVEGDEKFKRSPLSYSWSISGGTIYAGQGTKILVVSSDNLAGEQNITATVTIEGLPAGCAKTLSEMTGFAGQPQPAKVDEYPTDQYAGEIKARIDNFFIQLRNEPNSSGIIVVKSKTKENLVKMVEAQSKTMWFLKQDMSRVAYQIIYDKNAEQIEYWIVPKGAVLPSPENAINIKASEYADARKFFAPAARKHRK